MSRTRVAPIAEFKTGVGIGNATRIRDAAKARSVDVMVATRRFTLEAALRRIFSGRHADKFGFITLKGGSLMFFAEGVEPIDGRTTKDIDIELAGYTGTLADLGAIMKEVLSEIPELDDGVRFHVDAIETKEVAADRAVPGGNIACPVQIGVQVYEFSIDAGFHPLESRETIKQVPYRSLLPQRFADFDVPCHPLEYSLADKIQACSRHGIDNSRLRDYYDMTVFFARSCIDEELAAHAVIKVFSLYGEDGVPSSVDEIQALGEHFVARNADRWDGMRNAGTWAVPMEDLASVVGSLRARIQPILDRVHAAAPKP